MSELQSRLEKLFLRLDHMGLRVEQAVADALRASAENNVAAGRQVDEQDDVIDREEVEIESECIRLLALYQPAAIDLRKICFVIKVNNDLERIADKAATMGRRVKHIVADGVDLAKHPGCLALADAATDVLGRTVRLLNNPDAESAKAVIAADRRTDDAYKKFVRAVLGEARHEAAGVDAAMTLVLLARAMERIGDLCCNIAEDMIFLATGDIVRHAGLLEGDNRG
jgi:phosphate transport system protein